MRVHVLAAAVLFAVGFTVRWWLRQGLVLGDDPQEYGALLGILTNGPIWSDQLHLRFAGWLANYLAFWLFGVSESAFLMPTALLTSTFAIMALLTGMLGGPVDALCSAAGASPLGGMVPMYLLMSALHLAPWLKLVAGPRGEAGRS